MVHIERLNIFELDEVIDLFVECFEKDRYFAEEFKNKPNKKELLREMATPTIECCVSSGFSYGIVNNGKLVAFLLAFDYHYIRVHYPDLFDNIFSGNIKHENDIIFGELQRIGGHTLYIIGLGVDAKYRRRGYAETMLLQFLNLYASWNIAADVTSIYMEQLCMREAFNVIPLAPDYYFVVKKGNSY